jgi:hypothetical protein
MPVRSGISGGGSGGSSEDAPAECRLPARSPRGGVGESSPVGEQRDDAGLRMLARNCGRPDLGATAGSRVRLALILGDGRDRRLSKSTAPSRW